jgi:hypothetical protein
MGKLDKRISDLEDEIDGYSRKLKDAVEKEEENRISILINTSRQTLNILLEERHVRSFGAKLKDGIPLLQQNLALSPPSVPTEKEHDRCSRRVMDFPFLPEVTEKVLNTFNRIWMDADTEDGTGEFFVVVRFRG